MAGISFDFRNNVSSKKCAIPSPRIVNLEIGDESPGIASESVFSEIFLNNEVCRNIVKNSSNSICGCDKQSDKNFLIHSQLPLSTCNDRPSDKIKSTNDSDIDLDFLDLLKCADLPRAVESGAENFNSKKTAFDHKMKIIPNTEVCDGLSDLLASVAHHSSGKHDDNSILENSQAKNEGDGRIDPLDFEFDKNDGAHYLSPNNPSLKAESNLSDLLSSINIEDSDVTKGCLSSNNSLLKAEGNLSDLLSCINIEDTDVTKGVLTNNSLKAEGNLSDLLSSINIEDSDVTKGCVLTNNSLKEEGNLSDLLSSINIEDSDVTKGCVLTNNSLKAEGNLSDLLSSINIEDSDVTKVGSFNSRNMCNRNLGNESKIEKEAPVTDLSDLLSSIDLGDSNDYKVGSLNRVGTKLSENKKESCLADILSSIDINKSNKPDSTLLNSKQHKLSDKKVLETKSETCLSDLLSSIDIDKSNKPTSSVLSSKPFNLDFNDNNCISDSLNDFLSDIESSTSSSNSCSSSYSEKGSNSSKDSSTKSNPTDKTFESDSGYNSFDSAPKGFSFFNYSSDNQFSFNTLLTEKSHASIDVKHTDSKDAGNGNEEMSMSDLMTIVSPEFKIPVMSSLITVESSVSKDSSSMQDLIESLNIKDFCDKSSNLVDSNEESRSYDCVDGRMSENVRTEMETVDIQGDALLGKDGFVNDDEQITFIDLRECIKSADHHLTPSSPIKQDQSVENPSSECFSPKKILFYCEDELPQIKSNPFEFQNMSPRKRSKVNTKQTLFSKALVCKPKKDYSLLQKVSNIKNELLNNIILRPILIDCEVPQPIVDCVIQSDKCILSKTGRKYFGIDPPCELQ